MKQMMKKVPNQEEERFAPPSNRCLLALIQKV